MERHTIKRIADSQAIYLTNLETQLRHAADRVGRIKAATMKSPSTRIKAQIRMQTGQANLNLFLVDLDDAARLCPAIEMNLAFEAQRLGYDPTEYVRRFTEWYDGSGYVTVMTVKEAQGIVQRDLAVEKRLPWEANDG